MYFDGGIFLGRDPKTGSESLGLQSDFACAASYRAVYDDMHEGNAETLSLAKASKGRLWPLAVLNPLHWDMAQQPVNSFKSQGFRAILFCPSFQYWSVDHYSFQIAFKKCLALKLPLQFLVTKPEEISALVSLSRGSTTPILLRFWKSGGYSFLSDLISVGKTTKNFYFDVSHLVQNGGIAHLGQTVGFDRLFVASTSPYNLKLPSELLIRLAPELSETQKNLILGENLKKLFKVKTPSPKSNPLPSLDAHLKRPKIDTHWHSHGWDILEPKKGIENLKKICDLYHYAAVGISSVRALNYDLIGGNESTFEALDLDKRFFGYVVIDPLRPKESMNLLEKFSKHPRFLGIKTIQDYFDLSLDDDRYHDFWNWAAEHDAPVMAHIPGLVGAAQKFSKVKFISAHTTWDRLPKLTSSSGQIPKNIYFDIATSHAHRVPTSLRALINAVGNDRVLFSCDGPLMSPAWTLGKIIESDLSSKDLDRLYFDNAQSLFGVLNNLSK